MSLGPSEVESAEDFFLATSLRHRCVHVEFTAFIREEQHLHFCVSFSRVMKHHWRVSVTFQSLKHS